MRTRHACFACSLLLIGIPGAVPTVAQQPTTPSYNVVTQIALVVRDIDASAKAYADLFGMDMPPVIVTDLPDQAHTRYLGEPTEARAKLAFCRMENITIELIEPAQTTNNDGSWL